MFLICVGSDWEKQHVFWVVYLAFHVACVHNYLTFPMLWAGDYWQYSLNIAESFHLSLANTQRIVHLTCPAEPCKNIFFQIFILDITIYCTDTCITAYTCTSLLQIDSVHMVYPPQQESWFTLVFRNWECGELQPVSKHYTQIYWSWPTAFISERTCIMHSTFSLCLNSLKLHFLSGICILLHWVKNVSSLQNYWEIAFFKYSFNSLPID